MLSAAQLRLCCGLPQGSGQDHGRSPSCKTTVTMRGTPVSVYVTVTSVPMTETCSGSQMTETSSGEDGSTVIPSVTGVPSASYP